MEDSAQAPDLLAVDVGNSRLKFGVFVGATLCDTQAPDQTLPIAPAPLPEPTNSLGASIDEVESGALTEWLDRLALGPVRVVVGSVSSSSADRLTPCLIGWLAARNEPFKVESLLSEKMPIRTDVANPAGVGVDRLAAAIAANSLRRGDTPAIVVDVGTAITVDLISPDGVFQGGAILPGVRMAARALHEQTDALPDCDLSELEESPEAIGKDTLPALQAGLFWGAVGAVRELIDRQRDSLTSPPQVFLTGGAAPSVARLIGGPDYTVRHVAHLTLAGFALADRARNPQS